MTRWPPARCDYPSPGLLWPITNLGGLTPGRGGDPLVGDLGSRTEPLPWPAFPESRPARPEASAGPAFRLASLSPLSRLLGVPAASRAPGSPGCPHRPRLLSRAFLSGHGWHAPHGCARRDCPQRGPKRIMVRNQGARKAVSWGSPQPPTWGKPGHN